MESSSEPKCLCSSLAKFGHKVLDAVQHSEADMLLVMKYVATCTGVHVGLVMSNHPQSELRMLLYILTKTHDPQR